jgi:hypothetical protein
MVNEEKPMDECPVCHGTGFTIQVDFKRASKTRMQCSKCRGTGKVVPVQKNGIRVGRKIAETFFFQQLKDGAIAATLEIRVCPIIMNGRPQFKTNNVKVMFRRDEKPVPRLYLEIVRMTTKPEWRRQGLMRELVGNAIGDPKIEWAETLVDDSSPEGIALLKGFGFYEEAGKLIWEPKPEGTAG